MWHSPPVVLNKGDWTGPSPEGSLDIALTLAMADLKERFIDPEKGTIRYHEIRGAEPFERYRDLTRRLRSFDLASLTTRQRKLAFWINIYNTGVIHGVIELGLKNSVQEIPKFFDRVIYEVGGFRFSLNEMEHGILRGNRRHPYRILKPFQKKDPRLKFAIVPPDSRIHFALVCGARSCPPIGFYEADQIEFQLELAATSFINSPQVDLRPQTGTLFISRIFKWYRADFETKGEKIIDVLLTFLDEGEQKEFLKKNRDRVRIRYQPYDWNLNQ